MGIIMGLALTLSAMAVASIAGAADFSPKEIYKRMSPGVVLILATDGDGMVAKGTGSIIRSSGLILTNAHVIYNDEASRPFKRVVVYMKPETISGDPQKDLKTGYNAQVTHFDRSLDLAVLTMESPPSSLTTIPLANPQDVDIGDYVVAIGHPETAGLWTLTTGTISTLVKGMGGVNGKDVYQTETSLNRGNSGGPLLNGNGFIVGVNTAVSRLASDGFPITDINFAIKSEVARKWLGEKGVMVDYGAPAKPAEEKPPVTAEKPPAPGEKPPSAQPPAPPLPPTPPLLATPPPPSQPAAPERKAPARPEILTEKRPYKLRDLDSLVEKKMEELDKELEEFHQRDGGK